MEPIFIFLLNEFSPMNSLAPRALASEDILPYYDVVICALGYESRAQYLAEHLALRGKTKLALAFGDCKTHAYSENKRYFEASSFEILEVADEIFMETVGGRLKEVLCSPEGQWRSVCLDISSFSRIRLAYLVDLLVEFGQSTVIRLHAIYNIAQFSPPDRDDVPIRTAAPVTERYAGWSLKHDLPTVAIVGLGYEHGKALGAVEYLQADEIWVFDPHSPIGDYRDALRDANESLLEAVPNSKKIDYAVANPHDLFVRLESLVFGLVRDSRPIVLPFGPKIFTLVSLLIARLHPQLAVWRVSGGEPEEPTDRQPSEHSVFVEFLLGAPVPSSLSHD